MTTPILQRLAFVAGCAWMRGLHDKGKDVGRIRLKQIAREAIKSYPAKRKAKR